MNSKILSTLEYPKIIHRLQSHASTSLGKHTAEQLTPSSDLEEVKLRLQATDEATHVERLKGNAPFGGIRDIRASVHRAVIGGMLNAAELLDIATTVGGGIRLKKFISSFHADRSIPILFECSGLLSDNKKLEQDILSCIDDNAHVMDTASAALAAVRKDIRTGESRAKEKLDQMIRSSSVQKMLQDAIITMRSDRYVIPVKQEYRAHFGGIVHDTSASGATLFIEPEAIVQINNKLRELKVKEEKEVEKILQMLSAKTAEHADELLATVEALGELDFIFAKAGLAREWKATLPMMNDRGFMKLKRGRHPLLTGDAIPLDVELGNRYTAIIITGPNTGGKTVSLKTIGLLGLMAMSGLFLPAEDGSQMCVFDAVYADIGDEQSIEQNLSTFSSHMTNIIRILREMTPKSLVLLDEVGAGTDPAEGSALAIAILEYIHRMGSRIVATTHYSELKAYAFERSGVINASMEFDVQTLRPTYRLLIGVPGRSNAFEIADKLGLPKAIIEHARGQVDEDELRVEHMIATLEENRLSAETDRLAAERFRREAEQLRATLEDQKAKFAEQREKLLEKAEKEARDVVAKARREADEIVAELRKIAMEEQTSIKEHRLIDAKRRLDEAEPSTLHRRAGKRAMANVQPGDEVKVISLGQKGYVVELAGDTEVVVQLGIMKMKVSRSDVEPIAAPKPQTQHVAKVQRSRDENIRTELDLRGANLEDSLVEVDRFLDEAMLSNLGQVYIIHGKGTGVLRSGIHEFLRRHKHVKQYRLGAYGEGGNGVTVVEIK